MIETQIIKENNKPVAMILDYEEYKRLHAIDIDNEDFREAREIKASNKKWTSHKEMIEKIEKANSFQSSILAIEYQSEITKLNFSRPIRFLIIEV
jgi:hypothetical protein